jgi:hypothetical protein
MSMAIGKPLVIYLGGFYFMNHPFNLKLSELEIVDLSFEESIAIAEAEKVSGGWLVTTLALGEEGGIEDPPDCLPPIKHPPCDDLPIDPPCKPPIFLPGKPPEMTTMALGEEGGDLGFLDY